MKIARIIIGLEVHIELKTLSKMFCGCLADHFGKKPNTQTCPTCLGLPGALPVPNKKAIEWTILLGLAMEGNVQKESHFDRKNYFYPDLPKGYQISQYEAPFILGGRVILDSGKKVRTRRIHLEEDTGKLLHETIKGEKCTLIDFNRSGVPLVELVSEPDLSTSDEAKEYLEKIRQIVRSLKISNADMEKGSMRCEPNVNLEIQDNGKQYYTPITEIKNINSFRFAKKAIDFEVQRQFRVFQEKRIEKSEGNKETRGWDENRNETVLQREKEEASDYRYFPEPDIPPIEWSNEEIKGFQLRINSYELPWQKKDRYIKEGLSTYQANVIMTNQQMSRLFDDTWPLAKAAGISSKVVADVIINKRLPLEAKAGNIIDYIESKKQKIEISEEELNEIIERHLRENPEVVSSFKKGKTQALGLIVGLVRQETGVVVSLEKIADRIK